ncbi:hypothetical protein [Streptomyces hundungensis]|uniref:hypothetical protein n=1 Tax=Streptomyces hundungensis TaxID=1077946 RepID=UPI0033C14D42
MVAPPVPRTWACAARSWLCGGSAVLRRAVTELPIAMAHDMRGTVPLTDIKFCRTRASWE